jgi:uridine phosphorylase
MGILAVEMEAAALYAFSEARNKPVICFAQVTNQMGSIEGDFEKGLDYGSYDGMQLIHLAATTWLSWNLK